MLEHIKNDSAFFSEAYRTLKPNGEIYIATTSKFCPYQQEVGWLPCFPWYPQKIKVFLLKKIQKKYPSLIGYTEYPAFNWYTKKQIIKLAKSAGFEKIFDRWDYISENAGKHGFKNNIKRLLSNNFGKAIANFLTPGSYYVIKK